MTDEKDQSQFQKWYSSGENAKHLNEKRRNRYKTDPEYRKSIVERQAQYRKENPPPSRAGAGRMKVVAGKKVEAFRISTVAEMIGRSDQTIRDWERTGLIPHPSIESAHRYYTKVQVTLMKELGDLIAVLRNDPSDVRKSVVSEKSKEVHEKWNLLGA